MQIGIGLPSTVKGASPALILDWARRADVGPFSSLGIIDRLVYGNYETLITLAAAAAVTQRVKLTTSILLAPLRNAAILAKQAATLDVFSGGRLTLGLGVGGREDDFRAAHASLRGRGRHLEKQLELMKRIWSGQPVSEDIGPIGPPPKRPGGPEILIGGYTPEAIRRVGRWGDGFISGGSADALHARHNYDIAVEAWKAEGRPGKPRFVGAIYYALGANARERGAMSLRDYYSFLGPRVEHMVATILASAEQVKNVIKAYTDVGADELILWPTIAELDQVDHLVDVVTR